MSDDFKMNYDKNMQEHHKDNGLNEDLGGINDMLNKEELKKKELPQMRGDVQGRIKSDLCHSGEKCGMTQQKEFGKME